MAKWDIKPTTLMGMMGYIQIMLAARGKPKIIRTWSFFNVFHGNAVLGSVMWRMCFSRGKEKCGSFGKCINMLFNYFVSMGRFNKNQLFVMFDHVFVPCRVMRYGFHRPTMRNELEPCTAGSLSNLFQPGDLRSWRTQHDSICSKIVSCLEKAWKFGACGPCLTPFCRIATN